MADRVVKYVLRGDISDLQAKMVAAGKSVSAAADKMTAANAEGAKFRQGLSDVGDTAGKIGLVAAAGVTAAVAAAANFDQAMSNVQAATHETASNMDALRQAALEAGAQTAFSATEAAAGIENLAKAGVSTQDILAGGLSGALDLAAAGGVEVADAAETAATALTQFKLSGDQVPHVADLLAAAAGKAQGEVSDMSMALNQGGLVAAQMGLSIEETTGALAAFASAGLLGSDAGTSLKTMLLRLANPSAEAAKTMERLGINAYDANGQFVGMQDLAGQLSTAFEGQSQATRDAAMATIFGSDAIRAASILYSQGSQGIADWTAKVDDSGYAAETAALKMDNLKGDFEEFMGSLETALIGAGDGSQGMLRGLVQGATDAVNAFNDLSPAAQNTATAMLAVTAVTGGGLWFGSKVIQGVANTREALSNLGVTAGKTTGALRAVGGAGAALAGLYAIGQAMEALENSMMRAVPGVQELTSQLLNLRDAGVAAQFAKDLGDVGAALDRVSNAGLRGETLDQMHDMGRQLSFLASGAEKVASSVSDYQSLGEAEQAIKALDEALANIVNTGSPEAAADALATLAASQNLSASEVDKLTGLMPQYQEALAGAENAATLAASAEGDLAGATGTATSAVEDHTQAIAENIDAMREQRNAVIEGANAEIAYEAAIDDARQALRDNGKTLDITTEKGRANKTALIGMAAAWNNQSDAAKNAKGAHADAIATFVRVATQMGMNEAAARRYARQLFEIPPSRATQVTLDAAQAMGQLVDYRTMLANIPRSVQTIVNTTYTQSRGRQMGGDVTPQADGSVLDFYANGGVRENHVAQIAPAGSWRVWAEPETGGEAYIPLAPSKRARSRQIAAETVDRLGGDVQWFANGGLTEKEREALERRREFDSGLKDFRLRGDLGVKGVREEFRDLREVLRETKHEWTDAMEKLAARAVKVARAYDKQSEALDKSRDTLRDLRSDRASYTSSVAGTFRNDLFGNGVAGLQLQLEADRNDAQAMLAAIRKGDKKGLSGGLEQALIASGDLTTAQQIAQMSRAEIRQLERLYAQRTSATSALGKFGGEEVYGQQIRQQSRLINKQSRTLDRLNNKLDRLEEAVERGARKGVGDKDRETNQRRRARG